MRSILANDQLGPAIVTDNLTLQIVVRQGVDERWCRKDLAARFDISISNSRTL